MAFSGIKSSYIADLLVFGSYSNLRPSNLYTTAAAFPVWDGLPQRLNLRISLWISLDLHR